MISKMINILEKYTNWKNILVSLFLFILCGTFIMTLGFGQIKFDLAHLMDSKDFYSLTTFYQNIELYGVQGRMSYLILHIFDYVLIVSLTLFLMFVLYALAKKTSTEIRIHSLALFPLLYAINDILENICIDLSLLIYPKQIIVFGFLSGYFTTMKLMALNICFVLITLLSLIVFVKGFIAGLKD